MSFRTDERDAEELFRAWRDRGDTGARDRLLSILRARLRTKIGGRRNSASSTADASDYAQSVIRTLIRRNDPCRFGSAKELFAYALRAGTNRRIDGDREVQRRGLVRTALEEIASGSTELKDIEHEDLAASFRRALDALPEDVRAVYELRLDGASIRDAAERLGISKEAVRDREKRARRTMRKLLDD